MKIHGFSPGTSVLEQVHNSEKTTSSTSVSIGAANHPVAATGINIGSTTARATY